MSYSAHIVDTDHRFTYIAARRTFVAESSELHGVGLFGRLFDDACDIGIRLRSTRTGKIVTFTLVKEHSDSEGDVTHWEYRSHNAVGHIEEMTLEIFND